MIVGVGLDIESIERFREMRYEIFRRVASRVLTQREGADCFEKADPYPHVAARFCAKEAFVKALGLERPWLIPFKDVEVVGVPPRLEARGRAAAELRKKGVSRIHVSISHTTEYAAAVVLLEA